LAKLATTAKMMMPNTSSRTAAPMITCPSREVSFCSSAKTRAVMPMLVAVRAAPAKMAGMTGT
jgi:hypothetical protein